MKTYHFVFLLLIGISGNVSAFDLNQAYVEDSFYLGYKAEGATWDGEYLWITSRDETSYKKYSTTGGTITEVKSIPAISIIGLAWDGIYLWSSAGDNYYQIDADTGDVVSTLTVAAPGNSSQGGLTFDGQYLWKSKRPNFVQIDPVSGAIIDNINEFDLPGIEEGLTFDGRYLYSISYTSAADPKITKIDPIFHQQLESFALPTGTTYNGLAFDGNSLWAVGWESQMLYKISQILNPVEVSVDVRPGQDPECNGSIPVAILGSDTLDVTQIEPNSLSFEGLNVRVRGNGALSCRIDDINSDGYADIVCQYQDSKTEGSLRGELLDGTPIEGTDVICVAH